MGLPDREARQATDPLGESQLHRCGSTRALRQMAQLAVRYGSSAGNLALSRAVGEVDTQRKEKVNRCAEES
eukprot:71561-Rhodomonas_salina.1